MTDEKPKPLFPPEIPQIQFPILDIEEPYERVTPSPVPVVLPFHSASGGTAYVAELFRNCSIKTVCQILVSAPIQIEPPALELEIDYEAFLSGVTREANLNLKIIPEVFSAWMLTLEKELGLKTSYIVISEAEMLIEKSSGIAIVPYISSPFFGEIEKLLDLITSYEIELRWMPCWFFGNIIRYAGSPYSYPVGIGGSSGVIWHVDSVRNRIYELSVVDFHVIRYAGTPLTHPWGAGGNESVIWHTDQFPARVYELSVVDFSSIRYGGAPCDPVADIGGDDDTIWTTEYSANKIYELSTTDFSVLQFGNAPDGDSFGVGGNGSVIWHSSWGAQKVYQLSPSDFSVICERYKGIEMRGVGGKEDVIWYSDYTNKRVGEMHV